MAAITKASQLSTSLSSLNPPASHRLPGVAGETIAQGDACYLKSDGKIWKATGAAADAAAEVWGFALTDAIADDAITLIYDERMHYCATAQTPGIKLYLSGTTAGGLDTAKSTGGTVPAAVVLEDGKRIHVYQTVQVQEVIAAAEGE